MTPDASRANSWTRLVLALVHVPVVMFPAVYTLTNAADLPVPYTNPVPPIALCLGNGALQLRHSFAAVRGVRAPGGLWTFLAMLVVAYAPMPWFGYYNWAFAPTLLIASAPMVFRGRGGFAVAGAIALLSGILAGAGIGSTLGLTNAERVVLFFNHFMIMALVGTFLFGATRLVRLLDELHATRSELAELAVGRERLRVSRDLHDLLGQSLSAISLKGDLAIKLLQRNAPAAQAEIESLTAVARDAIRGVQAVAREEHAVSLRRETEGAAALLTAAGIATIIDVAVTNLPESVEEMFAWAIREGVANVLLHSAARSCSIVAARQTATFCLEIVNDGASPPNGEGHGLAGLAVRARALSGTVSATQDDGRFRLLVQIPQGRVPEEGTA